MQSRSLAACRREMHQCLILNHDLLRDKDDVLVTELL